MMPRGANKRREREYGEIVHEFQKEGRYGGRQKEVAARIVNKQRAKAGETKSARAATRSAGGSRSSATTRRPSRSTGKQRTTSGRGTSAMRRTSTTRGTGARRTTS